MSYIPNTTHDQQKMLEAIGVSSIADLFSPIPESIRQAADFSGVDDALDDVTLKQHLIALSAKNADMDHFPCFLGAGLYDHYIPPTVAHVTGRSEFYTAYTPYQPEVSQGVLQSIYEFQSLVCRLTGMDVANASMYDGATALAEATIMACDLSKRRHVTLPASLHPAFRQVVETYLEPLNIPIQTLPMDTTTGKLDLSGLNADTGCVVVSYPNLYGVVEELAGVCDAAHAVGALCVVVADPISLGLLQTPGDAGADIVVAEGQGLGVFSAFGGPLLGLFACRKEFVRRIPGRIVGGAVDAEGRRAYTMTLRTREQDIRRDTATSNICTNQALFALAATVYLATIGKGLAQIANLCVQKSHYALDAITAIPGYSPLFSGSFVKEFAVRTPGDPTEINRRLLERGLIGGLPLPEFGDAMLFCVTEQRTKEDIDRLVLALQA